MAAMDVDEPCVGYDIGGLDLVEAAVRRAAALRTEALDTAAQQEQQQLRGDFAHWRMERMRGLERMHVQNLAELTPLLSQFGQSSGRREDDRAVKGVLALWVSTMEKRIPELQRDVLSRLDILEQRVHHAFSRVRLAKQALARRREQVAARRESLKCTYPRAGPSMREEREQVTKELIVQLTQRCPGAGEAMATQMGTHVAAQGDPSAEQRHSPADCSPGVRLMLGQLDGLERLRSRAAATRRDLDAGEEQHAQALAHRLAEVERLKEAVGRQVDYVAVPHEP